MNKDFPYKLKMPANVSFEQLCELFCITQDEYWGNDGNTRRWLRNARLDIILYFRYEDDYLAVKMKYC